MNAITDKYVARLLAANHERARLQALQQEADALAASSAAITQIRQTMPLDQQITELMLTLPTPMRDRPWSMAECEWRGIGSQRGGAKGSQSIA